MIAMWRGSFARSISSRSCRSKEPGAARMSDVDHPEEFSAAPGRSTRQKTRSSVSLRPAAFGEGGGGRRSRAGARRGRPARGRARRRRARRRSSAPCRAGTRRRERAPRARRRPPRSSIEWSVRTVGSAAGGADGEDAEVALPGRAPRRARMRARRRARGEIGATNGASRGATTAGAAPAVDGTPSTSRRSARGSSGGGLADLEEPHVVGKPVVGGVADDSAARAAAAGRSGRPGPSAWTPASVRLAPSTRTAARASAASALCEGRLHGARRVLLHLPAVKLRSDVGDDGAIADGRAHGRPRWNRRRLGGGGEPDRLGIPMRIDVEVYAVDRGIEAAEISP